MYRTLLITNSFFSEHFCSIFSWMKLILKVYLKSIFVVLSRNTKSKLKESLVSSKNCSKCLVSCLCSFRVKALPRLYDSMEITYEFFPPFLRCLFYLKLFPYVFTSWPQSYKQSPISLAILFALGVYTLTSIPQEFLNIATFAPDGNKTWKVRNSSIFYMY